MESNIQRIRHGYWPESGFSNVWKRRNGCQNFARNAKRIENNEKRVTKPGWNIWDHIVNMECIVNVSCTFGNTPCNQKHWNTNRILWFWYRNHNTPNKHKTREDLYKCLYWIWWNKTYNCMENFNQLECLKECYCCRTCCP